MLEIEIAGNGWQSLNERNGSQYRKKGHEKEHCKRVEDCHC